MDLLVTLIVGGVVGWLASILMKTKADRGILANYVVGVAGSFLGLGIVAGLGLRAESPLSWLIVVVTAILTAAWLIVMLRTALGLVRPVGWR